jgi:AAA15 family ATPase/GTPase
MGTPLDQLSISGFKSIQDLQNFELKSINILIGSNGSGKSNFIDFT